MIHLSGVSKTYPNRITALSNLSLEVEAGEFVFISGPSGSGKSSLLRILYGLEPASSGEVIVDGLRLTQPGFKKVDQLRRRMGIISPDFKLLTDRNVRENVALTLEVIGCPHRDIQRMVLERLSQIGLLERAEDPIFSLSAGEQQRVSIARAVVRKPPLILADEPTGLLDEEMTEKVMAILSELHQEGTTILLATQDAHLIQRYPYRRIFLGAEESGDGNGEEGVIVEG
ncbi:MAG: ATP-binding cassette domain-containing protein [Desulfobacterota bacterium]|nr:ATP-binding cassette domain-containing protein [Thermodesulfobacteriota bacterium]